MSKLKEQQICKSCETQPARKVKGIWRRCAKCEQARLAKRTVFLQAAAEGLFLSQQAAAGIPPRYVSARLSDFQIKLDICPNFGYRVFSKPGTGKTHFLCAIAAHLVEQNRSVLFWNVPVLLNEIRRDIGSKSTAAIDQALAVDHLLLDDLGTQRDTDYASEQIYLIINQRYNACMHTSVSGNNWNAIGARLQGRIEETTKEILL